MARNSIERANGAVGTGRSRVPGARLVLALGLALAVAAPVSAAPTPLAMHEVAPGHFVHVGRHEELSAANGGNVATVGFVVGDDAVAVIDPGGGAVFARALHAALRARTDRPLSHVVLTHFHPDHVLGTRALLDAAAAEAGAVGSGTPAPAVAIVAHATHARARAQRGAFYLERFGALLDGAADGSGRSGAAALPGPTLHVAPGTPVRIELGGRTLRVDAWQTAHTDNDVSVFDPAHATLWSGDLVFAGHAPSLDGSLPGWIDTMDALAAFAPRVVVPGHGAPGPWAAVAGPQRDYLVGLLADVRRAIADGERLGDAVARAERRDAGRWRLFGLYHPANVTRAWAELEWE